MKFSSLANILTATVVCVHAKPLFETRDNTGAAIQCDDKHKPDFDACLRLHDSIDPNERFSGGPRERCNDGCCLSWSKDVTFSGDFAQGTIWDMGNRCKRRGSGIRRDVKIEGGVATFCLSDRGKGCV
ncbi:hypothetical protein DICA4_F31560 [Diutina catenulata]